MSRAATALRPRRQNKAARKVGSADPEMGRQCSAVALPYLRPRKAYVRASRAAREAYLPRLTVRRYVSPTAPPLRADRTPDVTSGPAWSRTRLTVALWPRQEGEARAANPGRHVQKCVFCEHRSK